MFFADNLAEFEIKNIIYAFYVYKNKNIAACCFW